MIKKNKNSALTPHDWKNLEEKFLTKEEFFKTITYLSQDIDEKFKIRDERLDRIEANMVTKADLAELIGEIKAIREEHAATWGLYLKHEDRLNSHEAQISALRVQYGIL